MIMRNCAILMSWDQKRVITNITMYMKSLRNNLKGTKKVDMKRSQFSSNKNGSLGRLKSLVRDLKQISEIHEAYNTVI